MNSRFEPPTIIEPLLRACSLPIHSPNPGQGGQSGPFGTMASALPIPLMSSPLLLVPLATSQHMVQKCISESVVLVRKTVEVVVVVAAALALVVKAELGSY